ncbi:hypothetical protein Syun_018843 [Stephania yunnanensis]|uniref:Exocyst component Exo84 C-terminal domain-containing protein n=1 Tax=Stephania yunnanensis TaxID=152371 RepID=A0AAP0NYT1_9MAGN
MESSEEEDDFPTHEWITPQSRINSIYQSNTEKGIRNLCCELLDLKDAVENLCGNMQSKYLAFLRMSDEVVEMEQELIELRKNASSHGILVQDLMRGVCRELEEWNLSNGEIPEAEEGPQFLETQDPLLSELDAHRIKFLENIDVLLAEYKVREAVDTLITEETNFPGLNDSGDPSYPKISSYKSAFLKRKAMLEEQLVGICEQPSLGSGELKEALTGLLKLGKGPLAHQSLLKVFGLRLQKSIDAFLPSCSIYPETYSAALSKLVFSTVLQTAKDSESIFSNMPVYSNKIVPWAERLLESFVQLVKTNAPPPETISAVSAVCVCFQASLSHCLQLEAQGLKLSTLLVVLLRPYMEEVLEMNFQRARKVAADLTINEETLPLSPQLIFPLSSVAVSSSDSVLIDSGTRFIYLVKEIVERLTPEAITHFGGAILTRIAHLFDNYIGALTNVLPSTSEDDNLTEQRDATQFKVETDAQQLALLGTAYTVADELLPMAVSRIWNMLDEIKETGRGSMENLGPTGIDTVEFKDWRRQLVISSDKFRDQFCRQYVVSFIFSRDDDTRLGAKTYLNTKGEDLIWDAHPMPSLPFQALFTKLQQLATVAGDVLLGKEKIQKSILGRLTNTVIMCLLSDEQEFWGVFEDESTPLEPHGLQQLILDIHFILEIAECGGYSTRQVHQSASAIIARAIKVFSARGIDPQNALPEDEWFADAAKVAISKFLLGTSGSEASETDDEHIIIHDDSSDSDVTDSCPSTVESSESFASANMGDSMGESESPVYLTEHDET